MFFLLLFLLLDLSSDSSGYQCTAGFMDYDLLIKKSSQIGNDMTLEDKGLGRLGNANSERYYILSHSTFTCSGNITGFLLGVDVRVDRNEYPEVFIAEKIDNEDTYSFKDSQSINLNAIDFPPDGVYKYILSSPLPFEAGEFIGIKQTQRNTNKVRFYYQRDEQHNISQVNKDNNETNQYSKTNSGHLQGRVLIHPISSNESCTNSFISSEDIREPATWITIIANNNFPNQDVFFKDIRLICNGTIKSIIVGANHYANQPNFPEIRVWHNGQFSSPHLSIVLNTSYEIKDNATWYNISQPISVSEGDILGIYQPTFDTAGTVIFYQRFNGPEIYVRMNNSELESANTNHYPLISVIFETVENTMTESVLLPSSTFQFTSIATVDSMESSSMLTFVDNTITSSVITTSSSVTETVSSVSSSPSSILNTSGTAMRSDITTSIPHTTIISIVTTSSPVTKTVSTVSSSPVSSSPHSILNTSGTAIHEDSTSVSILYNSTTVSTEKTASVQLIGISVGIVIVMIIIIIIVIITTSSVGLMLYCRYYQRHHQSCDNVDTISNPSYEKLQDTHSSKHSQ